MLKAVVMRLLWGSRRVKPSSTAYSLNAGKFNKYQSSNNPAGATHMPVQPMSREIRKKECAKKKKKANIVLSKNLPALSVCFRYCTGVCWQGFGTHHGTMKGSITLLRHGCRKLCATPMRLVYRRVTVYILTPLWPIPYARAPGMRTM